MIQTRRLKNVLIFIQAIWKWFSFYFEFKPKRKFYHVNSRNKFQSNINLFKDFTFVSNFEGTFRWNFQIRKCILISSLLPGIFTRKYLCWSIFLINLQACMPKEAPVQVSSCKIWEIFENFRNCNAKKNVHWNRHMERSGFKSFC